MKTYNFVMGYRISNYFKSSKYMTSSLGYSYTEEDKRGERVLNQKDGFALSYNHTYGASLMKFGNMGNIDFYVDTGINAPHVAIYYDLEEYVIEWDDNYYKSFGIDAYIGKILKHVTSKHSQKISTTSNYEQLEKKVIIKEDESISNKVDNLDLNSETHGTPEGNSETVLKSPGSASYADILAYVRSKTKK